MTGEQKIEDLIKDVERGLLILPEFQRGYVWKRPAVRSYLTSLYRGYPTGSLLIWKTPAPGKVRGASLEDSDSKYFQLILDGQQRLTSIFVLMTGEPPPFYEGEELFFNIYFNLLDESFMYWKSTVMKGKPEWVPVTTFFQEGFASFVQSRSEADEEAKKLYFENLAKLQRLDAIRNYPYHVKTLTEGLMDRVVEIFNLVNSSGTTLSKSDLALAHICSSWPEARDSFASTKKRLAGHGFEFPMEFFTRATSSTATGSALYEPLYRTPTADVRAAWIKVDRTLDYISNLLRSEAYLDSSDNLSSPMPLIPLIVYLSRKGETFSNRNEMWDFLHWMYAALMWGRYSGSSETQLNQDLATLDQPNAPEQLRTNLLQQRGRVKVEPRDLERAGVRSTLYPMAYIVARSKGAVDWFNGQPLYTKNAGAMFGLEDHHIFPQSLLYKGKYSASDTGHRQVVNQTANLAFLTKKTNIKISNNDPLSYLREVEERFPGALDAQMVPMDRSLWNMDRFEDFLEARRHLLADAINSFMDDLLREPTKSHTGILDLIGQGESRQVEYKATLRFDLDKNGPSREVPKGIARTIAAFLNTDGGTLIIGVQDDGAILGIEPDLKLIGKNNLDGFELTFRNVLRDYLPGEVGPLVELTFADIEGKTIAVAHCEPYNRPIFLTDGSNVFFLVRSGNSSQPLDVRATASYIKDHWPSS